MEDHMNTLTVQIARVSIKMQIVLVILVAFFNYSAERELIVSL